MGMGIGTVIADRIVTWAVKRAAQTPRVSGDGVAGMPLWSEWSTRRAIKDGYKAHYALYAVVSDLADCIRSVPWHLYRRMKDGAEIVDTHPLAELVRRPNPDQTWGALLEAWDIYKSLAGNGYGLIQVGDGVTAWSLRPDRMKPIPDKRGRIARWEYTVDGKPDYYPAEEILHFKFFDPGNDHLGMAPLQAAARLVDTSTAGLASNNALVNNLGRSAGMFSPKVQGLGNEQFTDWEKSLKKHFSGPKNAGKYLINPFEAEFTQMEFSPVELDYLASFKTYEEGIYKAFHVLADAMGGEAKYENRRGAIREKWAGPVTSRLREMRAVLNLRFGPLFDTAYPARPGQMYLDYDMADTPAVVEARKELIESAKHVWEMGVPWDVVDREMDLGFGPQPGGDTGYLPVQVLPVGQSAPVRATRSWNPTSDDARAAHWRSVETRKQGWERGVAEKVKVLFAGERKAVVKAIEDGSLDVDYLIDGHRGDWSSVISAVLRVVIEDFGDQVDRELRARRDWDPWSDLVREWVTTRTAEDVAHILTTTKAAIRKVVLSGLDDGKSMVQIAKAVREQFEAWEGGTGVYRSMMIARTEVHRAAGFGMHESARQSGVAQEKAWQDAGDERVRDAHQTNTAAGWIAFDDAYPNGAMYPGDGTDDIGCRCVEMYRSR